MRQQYALKAIKAAEVKAEKTKVDTEVKAAETAYLQETNPAEKERKKQELIKKRIELRKITQELTAADAAVTASEQEASSAEAAAKLSKPCKRYQSVYRRALIGLAGACRRGAPTGELHARCALYEKELAARKLQKDPSLSTQWLLLRLDVELPGPAPATKPADCKVGICYRVKQPYIISYWMDNARYSKLVELPNRSPLISIDIERAFLVQKVQQIEFDDTGFLTKVKIEKKSELLAAASASTRRASITSTTSRAS